MSTLELKNNDYQVWFDPALNTVFCKGFLRLDGVDGYQEIMDLLLFGVATAHPKVTVDLSQLQFLNSSGISMLSMFVIKVREKGDLQLIVRGSEKILWQTKSLRNLKRLMPAMMLEFI